ncbi:MAG: hypothetical protein ACYDC1_07410 [Limisphaerales bacterium]
MNDPAMKTGDTFSSPPLPTDLREWFSAEELLDLVLEAVGGLDFGGRRGRVLSAEEGIFPFPMLCTLLTYCYATRRLASDDIEAQQVEDPVLRYICAGAYPQWATLRRFRRAQRGLIGAALSRAYALAWARRRQAGESAAAMTEEIVPVEAMAAAAEARLQRAVLADAGAQDW